ncbi:hypothetical protein ZEAMMB73_Zm00001d012792 [Zea mays]|uniref:Uncharacterized protein n=1 Tax=Zea mays TaxID=4577 RepID=A0A1D6GCG0_MAIZE|nr:hypothetical protein ZEAMMB73_Zm00001d012792 [Zea mays]
MMRAAGVECARAAWVTGLLRTVASQRI